MWLTHSLFPRKYGAGRPAPPRIGRSSEKCGTVGRSTEPFSYNAKNTKVLNSQRAGKDSTPASVKKFYKRPRLKPRPHSPALQVQFPVPISQQISQLTCEISGNTLSKFSQKVAQTSQDASNAAKDAEQCDFMVSGLAESLKKIDDIEHLMASISDQMSLLAVQMALFSDLPPGDPKNLEVFSGTRTDQNGEHPNSPAG